MNITSKILFGAIVSILIVSCSSTKYQKSFVAEHLLCNKLYSIRNTNPATRQDVNIALRHFGTNHKSVQCNCSTDKDFSTCSLWSSAGYLTLSGVFK